jgi:hypothetical protein
MSGDLHKVEISLCLEEDEPFKPVIGFFMILGMNVMSMGTT